MAHIVGMGTGYQGVSKGMSLRHDLNLCRWYHEHWKRPLQSGDFESFDVTSITIIPDVLAAGM